MRKSLLAVFLLIPAGCPPPDDPPRADVPDPVAPERELSGFIYTADEEGNSVTRVDLVTMEATRAPIPISPHNLQASADGRLLLVVGPMADHARPDERDGHGTGGRLLVLDPETLEAERPAVEAGRHPAHVVVDGQNRFAYVTDSGTNSLLVLALDPGRVGATVPTCAYPHGLRMSPDESEIYVACVDDDQVSIVAVAARTVGRVPVGRGPIQVFATPDSRFVYAANEGTRERPDSTVTVIGTEPREVVATVATGAGAHGVVVSDDGRHAFVSSLFDHTVSGIEVAAQRVIETFPVGRGPAGITYRSAPAP